MFSLEQFASARRALAPGGIFCQWLPMFQMSEEEFNIVAATFLDVFPRTTLWRGDLAPDLPSNAPIPEPPLAAGRRWAVANAGDRSGNGLRGAERNRFGLNACAPLLLALLLALPASAQSPALEAATGALSGKLTDLHSRPLADATQKAREAGGAAGRLPGCSTYRTLKGSHSMSFAVV